jgi:integrase
MLYKRGGTWWFEFQIRGQRVRESSSSKSKTVAREAARRRRQELVDSINGLNKRPKPMLFSAAAKDYLEIKEKTLRASSYRIERTSVAHLKPMFGSVLISDIDGQSIAAYQRRRSGEGAAPATVNLETGTLRAILKRHRLWAFVQPDVKNLSERNDVGLALSRDDEDKLLAACGQSRSRSLYTAVSLAVNTGLRRAELLNLRWGQVNLDKKTIQVGDSKTDAGAGRIVPLNVRANGAIAFWAESFPDRKPKDAVFPTERVGAAGNDFTPCHTDTKHGTPVHSIKEAWEAAKRRAKVQCRWHDLRHTFCTRLLEQGVSLPQVGRILGWSSSTTVRMAERYGHISGDTLRKAVEMLDPPKPTDDDTAKDDKTTTQAQDAGTAVTNTAPEGVPQAGAIH